MQFAGIQLPITKANAHALGISIDELAGQPSQWVDVSGDWWACWQTWNEGREILNPHQARIRQNGEALEIVAVTRGTHAFEKGGYLWRGEMRIWDNEILMGWYVADEGAVRSKGTMYFQLHQHGTHMTGRWVGLSYDGPIVTGWARWPEQRNRRSRWSTSLRNRSRRRHDYRRHLRGCHHRAPRRLAGRIRSRSSGGATGGLRPEHQSKSGRSIDGRAPSRTRARRVAGSILA